MSEANRYRYKANEKLPIEILVFEMAAEHVDEFIRIDHDVWTLGEAFSDGLSRILFVSKEVWLDDSRPGEVTLVFVWESMAAWQTVGEEALQQRLLTEFDARFTHSYTMVRAPHDDSNAAIHRVSRFERCD